MVPSFPNHRRFPATQTHSPMLWQGILILKSMYRNWLFLINLPTSLNNRKLVQRNLQILNTPLKIGSIFHNGNLLSPLILTIIKTSKFQLLLMEIGKRLLINNRLLNGNLSEVPDMPRKVSKLHIRVDTELWVLPSPIKTISHTQTWLLQNPHISMEMMVSSMM